MKRFHIFPLLLFLLTTLVTFAAVESTDTVAFDDILLAFENGSKADGSWEDAKDWLAEHSDVALTHVLSLIDKSIPDNDQSNAIHRIFVYLDDESQKSAVPSLMEMLESDEIDVKIRAASFLGIVGPGAASAEGRLLELSGYPDSDFRRICIDALGKIAASPDRVISRLLEMLSDEVPDVRFAASYWLKQFGKEHLRQHRDELRLLLVQEDRQAAQFGRELLEFAELIPGLQSSGSSVDWSEHYQGESETPEFERLRVVVEIRNLVSQQYRPILIRGLIELDMGIGDLADLSILHSKLLNAVLEERPYGRTILGLSYFEGIGIERDLDRAIALWEEAAEAGDVSAQNLLGWLFHSGDGVARDYPKAIEYLTLAARQNDVSAQGNLGAFYLEGAGVQRDLDKAIDFLTASATGGSALSAYNLGGTFFSGNVPGVSPAVGAEWLKIAAELGEPDASVMLGNIYRQGVQDIPQDFSKAIYYYRLGAELGNPVAKLNLGQAYLSGIENVDPQDVGKALELLKESAEAGNADAQNTLGFVYTEGELVPENPREAIRWLEPAARSGNVRAFYNLARNIEKDVTDDESKLHAYALYYIASERGHRESREAVARIRETFRAEELLRSLDLVKETEVKYDLDEP